MCLCVWRTATAGGKTARMITPARLIGTTDGTGARVRTKTHMRAHVRARINQQILFIFSMKTHTKEIHTFAHTLKTLTQQSKTLTTIAAQYHTSNCTRSIAVTVIWTHALLQVLTDALKAASAESGLKFTPHPSPCVKKSGPSPTFTPSTPKRQAAACSSGSMGQTPTRRQLSTTLTTHSNTKALPSQCYSVWLQHPSLCEVLKCTVLYCITLAVPIKRISCPFLRH